MDKSLIVVIDQFTDRVFDYENTLLLDYGYYSEIQMYDNWYWDGVQTEYGTYDDFYISQPSTGNTFYFVTPDTDSSVYAGFDATSTNDFDWDLKSSSTFTDSYGNLAGVDTYDVYTWLDQTDDTTVGHGDWVVDTICSNLDNPDRTTILCIDVDTLNGVDSHLDNLFDLDYYNSLLNGALVTKFESLIFDFFNFFDQRFNPSISSDQYVLAGASMSIAGAPASLTEGLAIQTFEDIGSLMIQAAPNVSQGYYDWGSNFPDVINVGAWNEDLGGNLLISSEATLDTVDIVADGYVTHPSWGSNFGTSFATPAVTAEYLNLLNDVLIQMNAEGDSLPSEPTDAPEFNYATLVTGVLDYISTPIYADFSDDGVNDPTEYRLLTTSLEANGVYPKTLALASGTGLVGYQVANATQNANQDATFSNAQLTGGIHSVGTTLTASIDFDDPNGVSGSSLTYTWYLKDGEAWSVVGDSSNQYTIQSGDIGSEIRFQVSFTDDDGYAEKSLAYGLEKTVVNETIDITNFVDQIWAKESGELAVLIGTNGTDQFTVSGELTGQQTHASVFMGDGDDTVTDSYGDDFVMFGDGTDTLNTSAGADLIYKAGSGSLTINSSPDGVWSHGYYAQNVGLSNAIGTQNLISLAGLYKNSDSIIWGHGEIDWILNTDLPDTAVKGVALFTDDVFSPTHPDVNEVASYFYGQQVEIGEGYRDIYLATPVSGASVTVNGSDLSDVFDFTSELFTAYPKIEGYDVALFGHGGDDVIWAGGGYASIDGGAGDDIINGGYGDNTLTGGSGSDIFEFTATSGNDTITDFNKDEDELHFYFREGEAEESAVASINNGIVTWDTVTVDLGDSSLALSDLSIHYDMI